jgi:acylphosphatase
LGSGLDKKMKKRVIIRIYGFVQGVGFRYYTIGEAQKLGLSGWVKNEPDGSITIVAEGEEDKLKKMIDWAKKGPSWASVEDVKIDWQEPIGEEGFEVRY